MVVGRCLICEGRVAQRCYDDPAFESCLCGMNETHSMNRDAEPETLAEIYNAHDYRETHQSLPPEWTKSPAIRGGGPRP